MTSSGASGERAPERSVVRDGSPPSRAFPLDLGHGGTPGLATATGDSSRAFPRSPLVRDRELEREGGAGSRTRASVALDAGERGNGHPISASLVGFSAVARGNGGRERGRPAGDGIGAGASTHHPVEATRSPAATGLRAVASLASPPRAIEPRIPPDDGAEPSRAAREVVAAAPLDGRPIAGSFPGTEVRRLDLPTASGASPQPRRPPSGSRPATGLERGNSATTVDRS